jgi:hypothetical protein
LRCRRLGQGYFEIFARSALPAVIANRCRPFTMMATATGA